MSTLNELNFRKAQ